MGNLLEARRDPLGFLQRLAGHPSPVVGFRLGPYAGYLLKEPEGIQHVLQANHRNYSKDNLNYRSLKPVLGEGLITSEGELWRRQRRALQPAFHKDRLQEFGALTTKRTNEMLDRWQLAADEGKALDMWSEITGLTLGVISEWLFGVEIQSRADRVQATFDVLNADVSDRLRNVYFLPRWIPTRRNRRFHAALSELEQIIREVIAAMELGDGSAQGPLGYLLKAEQGTEARITRRQLRDEVMTLLLAGHETTAALLTWSLHLLSTHPRVTAHLHEVLDQALESRTPTAQALLGVGYAKQILEEALRIYPPIWVLSRTAKGHDRLGRYHIAPGSNLLLSPYATHRLPEYWRQPEQFDPDRFAGDSRAYRPQFAYFPFGGGPRQCIGRDLAMLEAQVILGAIMARYRLEPINAQLVEPEPLVTLRPNPSPKMVPHER